MTWANPPGLVREQDPAPLQTTAVRVLEGVAKQPQVPGGACGYLGDGRKRKRRRSGPAILLLLLTYILVYTTKVTCWVYRITHRITDSAMPGNVDILCRSISKAGG